MYIIHLLISFDHEKDKDSDKQVNQPVFLSKLSHEDSVMEY